jgi:hypothetical protein
MISIRPFGTQQVAVHRPSIRLKPREIGRKRNITTFSTFRIKDFGGMESISLEPEARTVLEDYLSDQTFCSQVYDNAKVESSGTVKFTGLLFEPVPWSPSTPHGMPQVCHTSVQERLQKTQSLRNLYSNFHCNMLK